MSVDSEIKNDLQISHKYKEGGFGWVIVLACAFCFGLNIAFINSYSLIYNEFINVYNETSSHVVYSAWIGSTAQGIQFIFCSISCILVDFFDARKIGCTGAIISTIGLISCAFVYDLKLYFLTYSVVFNVGQSLFLASFLSILPQYFNKSLGLANGLMIFGSAFLTISLPFVVSECLRLIGLSNLFFVLAGFSFVSALLTLTFKPQLRSTFVGTWKERVIKSLGLEVLKMRKFIIWALSVIIGFFGYLIPVVVISHHTAINFPDNSPALVTAILGAVSGFSGVVFGFISDHVPINAINFHILSFIIGGTIQITIQFATTFVQLCVIMGCYGLIDGIFLSFIVPISCEVTSSHTLSTQASGFLFFFIAIPSIVGPTVAGFIFEKYENYAVAFDIGGGSCIIAALFLLIVYPDTILKSVYKKLKGKSVDIMSSVEAGEIYENHSASTKF